MDELEWPDADWLSKRRLEEGDESDVCRERLPPELYEGGLEVRRSV